MSTWWRCALGIWDEGRAAPGHRPGRRSMLRMLPGPGAFPVRVWAHGRQPRDPPPRHPPSTRSPQRDETYEPPTELEERRARSAGLLFLLTTFVALLSMVAFLSNLFALAAGQYHTVRGGGYPAGISCTRQRGTGRRAGLGTGSLAPGSRSMGARCKVLWDSESAMSRPGVLCAGLLRCMPSLLQVHEQKSLFNPFLPVSGKGMEGGTAPACGTLHASVPALSHASDLLKLLFRAFCVAGGPGRPGRRHCVQGGHRREQAPAARAPCRCGRAGGHHTTACLPASLPASACLPAHGRFSAPCQPTLLPTLHLPLGCSSCCSCRMRSCLPRGCSPFL